MGADAATYDHSDLAQPAFVIGDLRALRDRLHTELDPDDLDRHLRTGGLRTLQEAIDIGHAALIQYLAE